MHLTYCRTRVNVNEKYIIHARQRACGRRRTGEDTPAGTAAAGRARQSTPTQFIIPFIDFFPPRPLLLRGGADVCNYIALGINFSLPPK